MTWRSSAAEMRPFTHEDHHRSRCVVEDRHAVRHSRLALAAVEADHLVKRFRGSKTVVDFDEKVAHCFDTNSTKLELASAVADVKRSFHTLQRTPTLQHFQTIDNELLHQLRIGDELWTAASSGAQENPEKSSSSSSEFRLLSLSLIFLLLKECH